MDGIAVPDIKGQAIEEFKSIDDENVSVMTNDSNNTPDIAEIDLTSIGVRVADDDRYRKFFKMLQFGVPLAAVKLKMTSEGLDPDMLE